MMLLLDVGNNYVKWAQLEAGRIGEPGRARRPPQGMQTFAKAAWGRLEPPEQVLAASVAGAAFNERLSAWMDKQWGVTPTFITAQAEAHGVRNAYTEPERLGADRWCAMIATRQIMRGPVCVLDCGTALTIDVLAADGAHQGGLIVPGLGLMRRSLLEDASGIQWDPEEEATGDIALLARDTQDGLTGGTLYALIAVIDRVVADVATELGTQMSRVISGGDAPAILPLLAGKYRHEPDLVLKGLAVIAHEQ